MNVLITGATKGIGKAIALKLASRGFNLALCARNQSDLNLIKDQILKEFPSVKVYIQATDCSRKEEVLSFAAQTLQEFGFIDVLINNVGMYEASNILDEADASFEKQMAVNVNCAYYLYKNIGLSMRNKRKGFIFNICSVASIENIVNAGSYCVTKAALLSLNNMMREEMKPYEVKVTALLPGSTLTNSWEGTTLDKDKFVQPEDVASMVNEVLKMSVGANIDQIIMKPLGGQI